MPHEIELRGIVGIDITAREISSELAKAGGTDVKFLVNSPGGLFFAGIEIHNLFRGYKGNIEVLITGMAASAASYFILPANKITAYDNATYMIHNARNLAIGDRHAMLKMHSILDGMDSIMAKAYGSKSDTLVGKIKSLMDAETFYFGDDMKAAGFVDEIIEAPEDAANALDKDTAITEARASVEMCIDGLRGSDAANEDINRAVAYVDSMSLLGEPKAAIPGEGDPDKLEAMKNVAIQSNNSSNALTPAGAGKTKQEDKQLKTLVELLADNPSAKAELDILIATARTEGETAAKDEMKAVIAKVSPIITSPDYGADVKTAGIEAITGDGHIATFETLVKITDRDIETAKAEAAKKETEEGEETPGAGGGKEVADAQAQATFQEKLDRTKGGVK